MDLPQIEERVLQALDMVYARDGMLLQGDSSEWSIAHRLAVYIEGQFPGWNVDCEFNRQGPKGEVKRQAGGNSVRPDIIVHHRGRPEREHNLLAIELKKGSSEPDQGKAREYTAPPNGARRFQYQFGLTLALTGPQGLTWFQEGRRCLA